MKKVKLSIGLLALVMGFSACQKDGINSDTSFLNTATASNPGNIFDVTNDNSGKVTITPTGQGVSYFVVKFGDAGNGSAEVKPGNNVTHAYAEGSYTVTIVSKSFSGKEVETTYPLQVTYRAPENVTISQSPTVYFLKVEPKADYANSFLVYFGDAANEVGTPVAVGGNARHTYTSAGTFTGKVVALSGGAAKTEQEFTYTVTPTFGFPITFEDAGTNYFFGTFGGGQQFATVDNPNPSGLNTSAKVGKFTRGWEAWSGTYSPINYIDLSQGKKIKVLAYNPDPALVGKKLNVELEKGSVDDGIAVLKTAFTKSGEWEELVFDFSTVPGLPADAKFSQLVLRFNDASEGAGAVIYVDDFVQTN